MSLRLADDQPSFRRQATKERGVRRHLILCAMTSLVMRATPLVGQEPHVSTQAPHDKPVSVTSDDQKRRFDVAIAPYIAQARATYPQAKQRYLAGLPPQQSIFVTTELRDAAGHSEMAFLAVDGLARDRVCISVRWWQQNSGLVSPPRPN
jgi:hypothetical protein